MVKRAELEKSFAALTEDLSTVRFRDCSKMIDEFIIANDCHIVFYEGDNDDPNKLPAVVPGSEYAVRTRWAV